MSVEQKTKMMHPQQDEQRFAEEFSENKRLAGKALKAYGAQVKSRNEDERIVQYLPLVHRIVSQVTSYLHPPLSREDLVSAGTVGLVKAARDFDPTKDAEFKTYAYIRVRGAVIDELRDWSFAPSSVKKLIDRANEISERILNERGSYPTDDELAEEMDIDLEKMYQIFETGRARHFLSINGVDEESPALGELLASGISQPGSRLERVELKEQLAGAIGQLSEKHRQVIVLYYHRELTMKQVAEVMELTESRVSQLHAAAVYKLSTWMNNLQEKNQSV